MPPVTVTSKLLTSARWPPPLAAMSKLVRICWPSAMTLNLRVPTEVDQSANRRLSR